MVHGSPSMSGPSLFPARGFAARAAPIHLEMPPTPGLQRTSAAGHLGASDRDPEATSPLLSLWRDAGVPRDGTMADTRTLHSSHLISTYWFPTPHSTR